MRYTVEYPSSFQRKILANEAPGEAPAKLDIIIPTITKPGEAFDIKVSVLDEKGYPSLQCEGSVQLKVPGHEGGAEIVFQRSSPASGLLKGIFLTEEGVFRLNGCLGGLHAYSNPTLCTREDAPGIHWGDPHVHTVLSNCHPDKCRSINFCFSAARYVSGLDWVSAADHVSNGRCEYGRWKEQRSVAELYNEPPAFVTLPAYEASLKGGAGGDNNIYMSRFPEIFVDDFEAGNVKTLCQKLSEIMSSDAFFAVPHHTTRTGKHGEIPDEIYPGSAFMPVMEIHSKWGTSEYRGNPNPLREIHDGPSYAMDLLERGLKLGFIGGTDTHATLPSGGGDEPNQLYALPGFTAVRSGELNRQSVFDAIRHRRCYAASGERILIHGTVAERDFGEELGFADLNTPPRIKAMIAAKNNISRIDLVRNGVTIHTVTPDSWKADFKFEDTEELDKKKLHSSYLKGFVYYYLRVTCESGAQAWTSPVWITEP